MSRFDLTRGHREPARIACMRSSCFSIVNSSTPTEETRPCYH